ncbi:alternate-type signal peptide domain-containing protein [Rhodococcus tukisamuensis]|uniref:Alternate signal-mediated exported protein, RER_14450 family n=1 Tax=Rhodococcus tukisamuensis TaxID=168276 RepID=A0A1G6SDH0_9NOCA|nr:alternate-type signal peptide domain-containing protein [Rhodococcus tukisamuensis]SDD14711.1 alternate signal-mediated exported protein, RER_14450 family [Rhodococcus tukisamuensis]
MNKQTKGAIAAGAAALLLAGGAGTMAAWNASTTVSGGAVNSGKLTLTTVSGSTGFKWVGGSKDGQAYNPSTDKIVPGDKVAYDAVVKVGAQGTNLAATLVADAASITGTNGLDAALTKTVTTTFNGGAVGTITEANNGQDLNVKVLFELPTSVTGTTAQDGTVNLNNFNVTLTQN